MENNFNLITRQEYERLLGNGINYEYAVIMACTKGNQLELCESISNKMKEDQQILMQETFKNMIPLERVEFSSTDAIVLGPRVEEVEDVNNNNHNL